jgi:hypothetical protein
MHSRSQNFGSLEVPPGGNAVIARRLLPLQPNVAMVFERKANNIGCNKVDVIARLPKTADKHSTAERIIFWHQKDYPGLNSPEHSARMLFGR